MPRKPNTELRRQQIVDGLLRTIATQGYTGATIQAIASASGLAPGLVHYHFRDKREILVSLVEQLGAYAAARFQSRAADAAGARERLRAYIDARLAYGSDANPDAVAAWVMIGAEAVRDPDVREIYQRAVRQEITLVRKLLRAYLVGSGKRVRKLDAFAAALLAFVEGVFVLASNARSLVPTGFAADMAAEWVERYAAAEPPATDRDAAVSKISSPRKSKGRQR
ncbi:TetR family transcriptional regulator C-terminal domain-containing protein [Dyella sp. 2RAB6]|uniref:TetR family transcriptional regulator C-terminal domain-containing protein n=1 Tax=Dyella sp. 2RAB6 TaxID=3232992 RepID=UPI003F8F3975